MFNRHSGIKYTTVQNKNPPMGLLVPGRQWEFNLQAHQTNLGQMKAPMCVLHCDVFICSSHLYAFCSLLLLFYTSHNSTGRYTIINWKEMLRESAEVPRKEIPHLQSLTYQLCALYTNWPGMHPVPAIAKYTDNAAKQVAACNFSADEYDTFRSNMQRVTDEGKSTNPFL
jgi:hypothetical protein